MPNKNIFSEQNLPLGFDSVKDDNEQILWTDKPKFLPYTMTALGLGTGMIIFLGLYFVMTKNITNIDGTPAFSIWFAAIPILIFLGSFFRKVFSYKNTSYAFTNKRIMVKNGFVGTAFRSIDYDNISNIEVSVNLIERAFNVGTIKIYSGRTVTNDDGITTKIYDRWEAIANPYKVFKYLKKVSLDIKTDFNYPNAFRPDTNPGYNTKYDPKKH